MIDDTFLRELAKNDDAYATLRTLFERTAITPDVWQRLQTEATQRDLSVNEYLQQLLDAARFLESAPSSMIITDSDEVRIQFVNAQFEADSGYSRDEVTGKNPRFMQGEDRDQPQIKAIRHAINHHQSCQVTLRNYRKDGTPFWNELRIRPVYDDSGTVTHYIGVQNDVTKRVEAEQALQAELRRNLHRYRRIVAHMADGVALIDKDYTYLAVNDGFVEYTRLDRDTLIGKTIADVLGDDIFYKVVKPRFDHSLAGEVIRYTTWYTFPTKGRRYLAVTYSPSRNEAGGIEGVIVMARDLTTEETLQEHILFQGQLLNQVADAVIAVDLNHSIIYWNKAAEDIYGWEAKEVIGRQVEEVLNPPGLEAEGLNHWEGISTHHRKDGTRIHMSVAGTELYDIDGEMMGAVSVNRDVTERKRMEEIEMALTLERERIAMLSEFVTHAYHEFRTPLTIVKTNAYLLNHITDDAKRSSKIDQINEQVARLTYLMDTMLLLTSLRQPDKSKWQTVQLAQSVHEVLRHEGMAPALHITETTPAIRANAEHVWLALREILHNARRYTPEGGGITVRVDHTPTHAFVQVADTGPGMPAEHLEHIFDMFWHMDHTHVTSGMGLGLTVVKRVIEQQGGHVTVESTLNEGTTVTCYFALAP